MCLICVLNVKALVLSWHFQSGEVPRSGLLRDCENRWIVCSSSREYCPAAALLLDKGSRISTLRDHHPRAPHPDEAAKEQKIGGIRNQILHCLSPRSQRTLPPVPSPFIKTKSSDKTAISRGHQRSNIYQFINDRRVLLLPSPLVLQKGPSEGS